jgi:hypothetical protein
MKSTIELEVALRGLRSARPKLTMSNDTLSDLWIEEALSRNYWLQLCEGGEARQTREAPRANQDAMAAAAAA